MPVSRATVVRRFPTLKAVEDLQEWEAAVADAQANIAADAFGDRYELAVTYYAAHLIELGHPELAAQQGPVSSETVGGVSRSYAVSAPAASSAPGELGSTAGGRLFRQLRGTLGLGIFVP